MGRRNGLAIPTEIGPRKFSSAAEAAEFYDVNHHVIGRALSTHCPEAYLTRRLLANCLSDPKDERTLGLVRELVNYLVVPDPVDTLLFLACKKNRVSVADAKSPSREKHLVKTRYEFIRAAHAEGFSISEISRILNRDRATIRAAFKPGEALKEE